MQPVTTFDMVHLLLPFMFCEHKYRAKLVQYVENITLAQALVYPLLKYPPSILAVAAVVCGAHLVVKQTNAKHKGMDEGLNAGLAELIGVDVAKTLECRKDVMQYINLDNLVLTNEQAQKVMAGAPLCICQPLYDSQLTVGGLGCADRAKKRQERLRRRKEGEFGAAGQPPNISAQQPTGPRQAL